MRVNECGKLGYTSFLDPPTMVCLNPPCDKQPLCSYSLPSRITVYDMLDHVRHQRLAPSAKHYSMFGKKTVQRYYDEREYIEASDVVFVKR